MRRLALCLVLFLVTISAATGVHAATDCEKWLTEYRNSLAHSPAAHRIKAAHHRLHHYIHSKIATLKKPQSKPKPRVLPARYTRPKMSRAELLKRLELACGDLPLDQPDIAKLTGDPVPEFVPETGDDSPVELASNDGGGLLPSMPPPAYTGVSTGGGFPGTGGFPLAPPIGGGGGTTPTNTPPGGVVVDQPPTVEAPEPGSVVLFVTGLSGLAEIIRRRRIR